MEKAPGVIFPVSTSRETFQGWNPIRSQLRDCPVLLENKARSTENHGVVISMEITLDSETIVHLDSSC
jgi:hypothetical protein